MHAALQTIIDLNLPDFRLVHDHPYGLSEIRAEGVFRRKYPTGDWMTSPQVFETVHNPFTALSLLDFDDGERGLLYLHDGSQAFFRDGATIRNILSMYDAWDEDYFISELNADIRLVPHGRITHAERWKMAQEFTRPPLLARSDKAGGTLPATFGSVWCDVRGVVVSAFYRESALMAGKGLDQYVDLELPYILRLVEVNGEAAAARVILPGPVGSAYKTNLLGEVIEEIPV
jgi:alpha-mannosidase